MKFKFLLLLLLVPALLHAKCHRYSCSRFQLPGWWGSADYMLIWRKERYYPALVTTNPTVNPVLSDPDTRILFGDEFVGGAPKSGGRFDLGFWMTPCLGFGTSWMFPGQEEVDFRIEGGPNGDPIFGRPFFNLFLNQQDAVPISFPAIFVNGRIDIDTTNRLWGYDLYARYRFLSSCHFKFDFIGGFIYSRIDDDLDIMTKTDLVALIPPSIIEMSDHFNCKNDYYAGLVGFMSEWRSNCWAVSVTGKLGLGNMVKTVNISGMTTTTTPLIVAPPVVVVDDFGLLAQPSNSGNHTSNHFEIIPQINANLQLKVLPHVWLTAGYTYMFWPAIVLAGEQVDLDINPSQNTGLIGPLGPIFDRKDTSFWIQGFTAGVYVFF